MQCRRPRFEPWVRKMPWRREWLPSPAFLPGNSPWTEEPGGLQSMGFQRVRHDWMTNTFTFHHYFQMKKILKLIGKKEQNSPLLQVLLESVCCSNKYLFNINDVIEWKNISYPGQSIGSVELMSYFSTQSPKNPGFSHYEIHSHLGPLTLFSLQLMVEEKTLSY